MPDEININVGNEGAEEEIPTEETPAEMEQLCQQLSLVREEQGRLTSAVMEAVSLMRSSHEASSTLTRELLESNSRMTSQLVEMATGIAAISTLSLSQQQTPGSASGDAGDPPTEADAAVVVIPPAETPPPESQARNQPRRFRRL